MKLNKYSQKSDRVANLYRAALYLAKGDKQTALIFLKPTAPHLAAKISPINSVSQKKFWAEKILDLYHTSLSHLGSVKN